MYKRFNFLGVFVLLVFSGIGGSLEASKYSSPSASCGSSPSTPDDDGIAPNKDWKPIFGEQVKKDADLILLIQKSVPKDWKDEPKKNVNLKKEQQDKKYLKIVAAASSQKFFGVKKK